MKKIIIIITLFLLAVAGYSQNLVYGSNAGYPFRGNYNTFIGINSGYDNYGSKDEGFGWGALYDNTGDSVIAIGWYAGQNNHKSNCIFIGGKDSTKGLFVNMKTGNVLVNGAGFSGGSGWGLTGNAGTDPATNGLGTVDTASMWIGVNSTPHIYMNRHIGDEFKRFVKFDSMVYVKTIGTTDKKPMIIKSNNISIGCFSSDSIYLRNLNYSFDLGTPFINGLSYKSGSNHYVNGIANSGRLFSASGWIDDNDGLWSCDHQKFR